MEKERLIHKSMNKEAKDNETKYKVFVYGTLRQGESNQYYLQGAECLYTSCWTHGRLFDTGYGYPGLVQDDQCKVQGELYLVNKEQLISLDGLEDYKGEGMDNLYDRIVQTIYTQYGQEDAFIYVYPKHLLQPEDEIVSGDWKAYRMENQI